MRSYEENDNANLNLKVFLRFINSKDESRSDWTFDRERG